MNPCWYLDSSAIVKLVVHEPESPALRQAIEGDMVLVTSALAGRIRLPALRSLDAIHLASAQCLHHQLEAFITYDTRQASAARQLGLTVLSPGAAPGGELEDWTP